MKLFFGPSALKKSMLVKVFVAVALFATVLIASSAAVSQPAAGQTPTSDIVFTAPTGLIVGRNRTLAIDASDSVADGSYTITCADATGVDATKMTVTRGTGANACTFTVDPVNNLAAASQGDATFSVLFTSSGGDTETGTFTVNIGPDSDIVFSPPNLLWVEPLMNIKIDLAKWVSDGDYAVTCTGASASQYHPTYISNVSRDGCEVSFRPTFRNWSRVRNMSVSFSSSGGDTHSGTVRMRTIDGYSGITYTPPSPNPSVTAGQSVVVDASEWAKEDGLGGLFTLFCDDATGVDAAKLSVSRFSCLYTITAEATATGTSSFTVPYYSSSGLSTRNASVTVDINTGSNLVFTAPTGLVVPKSTSITLDASEWAQDGSYDITCGDATNVSSSLTSVARAANSCSFTITAGATEGSATFTVPYTSSAGSANTANGVVPITIGPTSDITFTAPTGLRVVAQNLVHFDVSSYATDGPYDVSCGNISHSLLSFSIPTIEHLGNCIIAIETQSTGGTFRFNMAYSSSGGDTHTGTITFSPTSAHNTPSVRHIPTQTIGAGNTKVFDASAYASIGGGLSIVCRDAAHISSLFASITRSGCLYTVTAGSTQGTAVFRAVISSNSQIAAAHNVTFTIGPPSAITYTPASVRAATGGMTLIDASSYAADGSYAVSCGDAKSIDPKLSAVTRTANTCTYSVTVGNTTGAASFVVPYTSAGGAALDATVSITIVRPLSVIVFKEPFYLDLATNRTLTIDASDYASDAYGFTISCGAATGVDSKITIQRTGCSFVVTPTGTQGSASFTVPYTSSGGGTYNAVFTIDIGPASTISFSAPSGLTLGTNRSMTLDASSYAADGSYLITCGDATGVDSKITVTRPNANARSCEYSVTPTGATGTASFTVPYTSSGGHTANGTISIAITAASAIVYSAPTGLTMTAGSSMTINAASYATDGSYTITCGDAANRDAKIARITNTGCSYKITSGETTGTATFTVPYTSSGGHALAGQISVAITARARTVAPVFDRQSMMCGMLGYQPVRHSTADRITEADSSAAFCRTPTAIICLKANSQAEMPNRLVNTIGLKTALDNCYNSIS